MRATEVAVADEIAVGGVAVDGRDDEGLPVVHVRGVACCAAGRCRRPRSSATKGWICSDERASVLALCGGVGGAKLALGLYRVLDPGQLIVVVNTGDDFEHLGLSISPDIDTVLYTLGGVADPERGWGRADESWHFMAALREMGGEAWFQLGDRDLAMHVERTRQLGWAHTLSGIRRSRGARALGIQADDRADDRRPRADRRRN